MEKEQMPLGVRRDGSYYTRIEWASHTESDPTFWVVNLIRDDAERNGGTWGANTMGPAHVVLGFFGESQTVGRLRIFRNVGLDISILEELAKTIDIYYSNTDEPRRLRRQEDRIDDVEWTFLKRVDMEKAEGWQEIVLDESAEARYIRIDLLENHGTPPEIPWTETSEVKIYPR
jgi:hypothetical protein